MGKVYDVLRRFTTATPKTPLKLYKNDGTLIATITRGWFPEDITGESDGGEVKTVTITDRTGITFSQVSFFGFGGYKYERTSAPARPDGNPRQWVWNVKPAGLDTVEPYFIVDDAGNFLVDDAGNSLVAA